jgi:hypothetical protein
MIGRMAGVSEGCDKGDLQIGCVIWEQWNNGTVVLDLNPMKGDKTPGSMSLDYWPQQTTDPFLCSFIHSFTYLTGSVYQLHTKNCVRRWGFCPK